MENWQKKVTDTGIQEQTMSPHNDLLALPFEKKIKLLDDAGKTFAGELIDRLLAQRHEKRQKTNNVFRKQNPVWDFK
jgi:hypothetical protein